MGVSVGGEVGCRGFVCVSELYVIREVSSFIRGVGLESEFKNVVCV